MGGVAATELHEKGARVIGVGDVSGAVFDPGGLDVPTLHEYAREHGSLEGFAARRLSHEELLELPCDVLVLAAREDQVGEENAPALRCRLVAEGANGPTSVAADEILAERGIPVLPDVLTNAGGVTVSYFEWVQDLSRLFWDRDEIRRRLAEKLGDAFDRVWTLAAERRHLAAERGADRRHPRRRRGTRSAGNLSMSAARPGRDGPEPAPLEAGASAQEAGEALMRPEVRAVLVSDGGELVGVITRKTLVREVVARGLDPRTTTLREIAEPPNATIECDTRSNEAFAFLEENDYERVPVVDHDGRLVGVLSRSSVRRRLAEDEPPAARRLGCDRGGPGLSPAVSRGRREAAREPRRRPAGRRRRTSRSPGRRRPRPRRRGRPSRRAPCGARPAPTPHRTSPALEPITATGFVRKTFVAIGREAQSSAFLSAPGTDELYSGVANRTASAEATAARSAATAGGAGSASSSSSYGGTSRSPSQSSNVSSGESSSPAARSNAVLCESRRRLPEIARMCIVTPP